MLVNLNPLFRLCLYARNFFQVTVVSAYHINKENDPNIQEILFKNDIEKLLEESSHKQLRETFDPFEAVQHFGHIFKVFNMLLLKKYMSNSTASKANRKVPNLTKRKNTLNHVNGIKEFSLAACLK